MRKFLLPILLLILSCEETLEPEDCAGVVGGTAVEDDCGICTGVDGYVAGTCYDCVDIPNGAAVVDNCGVCDGIDGYVAGTCYDCTDTPNGNAVIDDCGVCDGIDGYIAGTCYDCVDIPNGAAEFDNCGVCDADTSNDCSQDCLGVWGGDATLAECEALGDMSALQDIINLNNLFPSDAPFYEPTEIGEQTWTNGRLTSLDLSYWSLDTLPSSIANFTALTNLDLESNNISVLPNTISNLTALTNLDLRYNIISTMPSSISYLINLTSLDLYGNDLTALPEEICTIYDALTTLELRSNRICPPYPECITDDDLDYQYQNECESIGCMDNTACNFDETALYSYLNDTCWHNNEECECSDGQNANIDNCGICDGSFSNDCTQDCNGEWGGTIVEDCTGECGGTMVDANSDGFCDEWVDLTVTDVDGNVYETVQIGGQLWLTENLKVTHYNDGTAISTGHSNSDWANLTTGAYAVYNNNSSNADVYGNLYNGFAVVDERGICSEGCHVPTDVEIKELEMYLGMSEEEANKGYTYRGTDEGVKLAGNADLWKDGGIENNSEFGTSGFNALPGGSRSTGDGKYDYILEGSYFWSSSETYEGNLWNRGLRYNQYRVHRYGNVKNQGFSVRCIKD